MLVVPQAPPKPLRWQRPGYSSLARQFDVSSTASQFAWSLFWDNLRGQCTSAQRSRRARWLTERLVQLGPAFIKVGQALSTRPDLIPAEYIDCLSQLQDSVPPFPTQEAIATIEAELGQPLHEVFAEFEPEPIAAASLGQVHRARLPSGEAVVVKIQRPGLEPLFDLDFKVLRRLIGLCERYLPWTKNYDLEGIYQEFFRVLYQEIDYIREGHNADRFRENFRDFTNIIVPKIYWPFTTEKVLVMEYIPGIKVDDRQALEACGLDPRELNKLGISCYLKQLLQDGFFQADPHPGNLAVAQDGSLIFYDFGMMVEVKSLAKDTMVRTLFAVLKKDTDGVLETLIDMGLIQPVPDMRPVRKLLRFTLERFAERPVNVEEFSQMRSDIYAAFEQQPFRLPPQMTYILKSLTTLDGIARTLDPEYNLIALAKPFVKRLAGMKDASGRGVREFIDQARQLVMTKVQERFDRSRAVELAITRLEERLESGEFEFQVKSQQSDRALKRLNLAIECLMYACVAGCTFLGGAVLLSGPAAHWASFAFAAAGVSTVIFIQGLVRLEIRKRLDRLAD